MKEKRFWYLNAAFWLILLAVMINWSLSFFSDYFKMDEGGLIWFILGFYLFAPYFLLSVFLLSLFKFLFDKFVKKYKSNLLPTLFLSVLSLTAVSPFIDIFGRVRDFYTGDGSNLILTYPWPFIILGWLVVVKISATLLKTEVPQNWTEIISPSVITVSLLVILSPFLIMGRQQVTKNGYFCFLSVNQDDKQGCLKSKFINNAVIDDCYSSNQSLETNTCIYRIAVKNRDMLMCDLLAGELKEENKLLGWNYSEKEMCLSAVAYKSGEKSKCDSIAGEKLSSTCKELFDEWTEEETRRKEMASIIGKMLETMK